MPNRILKESICTSETIEQLSADEERCFYRLIVQCDDYGRFDGRASVVMGRCYPLKLEKDAIRVTDIDRWLQRLAQAGLIIMYVVRGVRYLQMTTWTKHQQVRATRSKFPDPMEGEVINHHMQSLDSKCDQEKSDETNGEQLHPYSYSNNDTRNTNTGIENNVGSAEPTNDKKPQRPPKSEDYTETFLRFWEMYPRTIDKKGAFSCWKAQLKKGTDPADLFTATGNYGQQCSGKEVQFILHPSTFLGPKDRWRDYLTPSPDVSPNRQRIPRAMSSLQEAMEDALREESGHDQN